MRVLQLIDSLRPGGAEKMAVNIANALLPHVEGSYLCCTRQEGMLKDQIKPEVEYLFLKKKNRLDSKAILELRRYIKQNKINILHVHGTSYFMGTVMKIAFPDIKLVWHDHLGERVNKIKSSYPVLYLCSMFFDGILTVNSELLEWVKENLRTKETSYINNFLAADFTGSFNNKEYLYLDGKKNIICIANLKIPKNHLNLLKAFNIVNKKFPQVELLLVGKKFNDGYQKTLERFIIENDLQNKVSLIGEKPNIIEYLRNSSIGVIASNSEGLPIALLEYGAGKLAVVSTNVGACPEVIGVNGRIVENDNYKALSEAIIYYLKDDKARQSDSEKFNLKVLNSYSEEFVLPDLIKYYQKI